MVKKHALWKYAAQWWFHHLEKLARVSWPKPVTEKATAILTAKSQALLNWVSIANPGNDIDGWGTSRDELASPLYYTASIGAYHVTSLLIDRKDEVNDISKDSRYGTALIAAAVGDRGAILKLLIDNGADVNLQGGVGRGTPLHCAVLQWGSAVLEGNPGVVQIILDSGARIDEDGGTFGSALQAAAFRGNSEIVTLLLNASANIHAKGGPYGSALQAAASRGNSEIVTLLLNASANIHTKGGYYGNALQAAIAGDKVDIAELLLDRGRLWIHRVQSGRNCLPKLKGDSEIARLPTDIARLPRDFVSFRRILEGILKRGGRGWKKEKKDNSEDGEVNAIFTGRDSS